jgi:hypothetical protein
MTKEEKRAVLAAQLATFRSWSYSDLAERVEIDRRAHDCLMVVEGAAPDGTQYQMEFLAVWDGRRGGDVRVLADLSEMPHRPLWGFIPIFISDVTDSFIMSPDGSFVGED